MLSKIVIILILLNLNVFICVVILLAPGYRNAPPYNQERFSKSTDKVYLCLNKISHISIRIDPSRIESSSRPCTSSSRNEQNTDVSKNWISYIALNEWKSPLLKYIWVKIKVSSCCIKVPEVFSICLHPDWLWVIFKDFKMSSCDVLLLSVVICC